MFRSASPRALGTIGRICCAAICLLLFAGIFPGVADADTPWSRPTQVYGYGQVFSVAFSPDGTRVAVGGDSNAVQIFNPGTGQHISFLFGHTDRVASVAFSPDGSKILTGSFDYTAKLWDAATGKEIRTFSGPNEYVYVWSVAFSPDGNKVLVGNENAAKLWDATTGAEIRSFGGGRSVVFSPDGSKVLTGYGAIAKLWDAATGELIRAFSGHTGSITSVAFSPDGSKVLTGSQDHTAKLWDASSGALIRTFSGHGSYVYSVAFSPDGNKVLTGSNDYTAKLWNTATGGVIRTFSHTVAVNAVAFSPDGSAVLTGSSDRTAKLWNSATGAEIRTFSRRCAPVNCVAFSPDGSEILTGSGPTDKTAVLWDAVTGDALRGFLGHASRINSVDFSPDGNKVLTGSDDKTAKLWDAATGGLIRTFSGHANAVNSVDFSPDGSKVLTASNSDSTAKLWNVATGAEIITFTGLGHVTSAAFSPDGSKVLTGSSDSPAKLWDASTGALIRGFSIESVSSVAFSPDGSEVLTGVYGSAAMLWDAATGTHIRTFSHLWGVNSVAFSPDGSRVLTGAEDSTTKVWDATTGAEIRAFSGVVNSIPFSPYGANSVAFSPYGSKVLTGNSQYVAVLWNTDTVTSAIQNLHPSAYTTGTLSIGGEPYLDRSWAFVSPLPSDLDGLPYVKTLDANQSSAAEVQMEFTAPRAVTIYLGFDERITPRPSWLDLWKETNMTLHVSGDVSGERKVFTKRYPPGLVQLYGNRPVGVSTGSMYTVIIGSSENSTLVGQSPVVLHGGNGYELVSPPAAITWLDAKSAAEQRFYWGRQGHLATITSLEESEFARVTFISGLPEVLRSAGDMLLGGYQPPSSPEPDGNWQWVTGETWGFTNWNTGEPNNTGLTGEGRLTAIAPGGKWNDVSDATTQNHYFVEYDNLPTVSVLSPGSGYSSGHQLYSGSPVYSDAENRFYEPIPAFLRGQMYITTRNADRGSTDGSFLHLDLSDAMIVYVAYDGYGTSRPSWLSAANGWQLLPMRLETDDLHPYRTICFKLFPLGVAVLGGSRDPGQIAENSMYTVILGGRNNAPPTAVRGDWTLYR